METSTLTNLLWIGGTFVVIGAFFIIKKSLKENGGGNGPSEPDDDSGKKRPVDPPLPSNPIKAKKAFLAHLKDFAKLLPTLLEGFVVKDWTDAIVSVKDPDLMGLWKKYVGLQETSTMWLKLLASWQVKCDTCKSFTCATNDNLAAYSLPDGGKLTKGTKYKVESPCWVHTFEDVQGNVRKEIITRGIVVPFEK